MNHNKINSLRRRRRDQRRGFTLIELLLVLVILAVLVGIVVANLNPSERTKQAKITAATTDISTIELALDSFAVDCQRLPRTEEGLGALIQQPQDATNWKGPYLKKGIPKDPWGNLYQYSSPGQHNTSGYDLWSYGPDGKDGAGDDIDNWTQK